MMRLVAFIAALLCSASQASAAPAPVVHWVQWGPGSAAELRAVAAGASCTDVMIDGGPYAMAQRAAPDANFPQAICALTLPAGARSVTLAGDTIPVPKPAPERIIVIGDTGCRVEGSVAQACNDPNRWPFATIAAVAAKLNPDLVIHVGDYDYRESPCPPGNPGCAGSVWGDNWPSWNTDFFAPAAPLLAAAPFVFVRGNHEECSRLGAGWLRLLGPLPFAVGAPCTEHIAPFGIPLGAITLAVLDNANAPDTDAPRDLVQLYRGDLQAIGKITPPPVWLVSHRPISGYVQLPLGITGGGNQTLLSAVRADGFPKNIELMISGHIHAFEAINYQGDVAPQLVAGNSGDTLSAVPTEISGLNLGGLPVSSGLTLPGFGFLLLTRAGADWRIDVFDVRGDKERTCEFATNRLRC